MNRPQVEAACRINTRRLLAAGTVLTVWGIAASIPVLAQSSSNFWYVLWCRQTYALTGTAGKALAWLSLLLFLGGIAQAGWTFVRGVMASSLLRRQFQRLIVPPPPSVLSAARAAGVADRFWYVTHRHPVALTLGLMRPLVILSDTTAEGLTESELVAILLHEASHGQRHDPFRHLLWASLSAGFGLLPGLRATASAARSCAELQADAQASSILGGTRALSQALLKMARRTTDARFTPGTAGFHDDLVLRARNLAGQDVSGAIITPSPSQRVPWFLWFAGAMALTSVLLPACLPR